ncbi:MAG: GNAT family N-acetyltransferase [Synechococcales bacterium]|nr:GNAT family N-acetyltransferase [Synechococcales bacterium]
MNIYSATQFCQAFQTAYYPDRTVQLQPFQLSDRTWYLPVLDGKKPIVLEAFQTAFIDFYEAQHHPVPPESGQLSDQNLGDQNLGDQNLGYQKTGSRNIGYLPRVSHGMVSVQTWQEQGLDQRYEPSPTVLLQEFDSWETFQRMVQQTKPKVFADSQRCRRKLEKEVGAIAFQLNDPDPEVIATCMRWKSAQYQKTGCADHFSQEAHVRLFKALQQQGLLLVSSLRAGDHLIAAHLGMLAEGRVYWWIPSYDTAYSKYSPGRLLLELGIEESFQQGYQEFDFLIGGESYKWVYATHTRLIGELGVRPLSLRTQQAAFATKERSKQWVRTCLQPFPGVLATVKDLRDRLKRRIKPEPTEDAIALMLQENG